MKCDGADLHVSCANHCANQLFLGAFEVTIPAPAARQTVNGFQPVNGLAKPLTGNGRTVNGRPFNRSTVSRTVNGFRKPLTVLNGQTVGPLTGTVNGFNGLNRSNR